MANFGIFKGFSDKLFEGELPTQLGKIGSEGFGFIGLLDDYPNAAAAYSLRLLRIAYTGSAIRVRRSSDNTESDIGFTPLGNLDTSSLTTFCGSGNGFVTTWYDQSGNAINATQTTAANQPQIVSSGSIYTNIGGLPTIRTDGTNDNLQTSTFTTINQPITILLVNKWISTNNFPYLLDLGTDRALGMITSTNTNQLYFGSALSSTITPNINNTQLWYTMANSSNSQITINNENIITGNAGSGTANKITIGSYGNNNYYSSSYFSEIIVYSSNQSSNRTGIQSNINTYYGIY